MLEVVDCNAVLISCPLCMPHQDDRLTFELLHLNHVGRGASRRLPLLVLIFKADILGMALVMRVMGLSTKHARSGLQD